MRTGKNKYKLEKEDLSFFYDILYRYEKEDKHNGYDYRLVDKKLKNKITLLHNQKSISTPKTKNTILYSGGPIIPALLRHVRNAFAHCNIRSTEGGLTYSFYDEYQGNCTMSGTMDKAIFHGLIKEIQKIRKI